jgi:hypothetical protein
MVMIAVVALVMIVVMVMIAVVALVMVMVMIAVVALVMIVVMIMAVAPVTGAIAWPPTWRPSGTGAIGFRRAEAVPWTAHAATPGVPAAALGLAPIVPRPAFVIAPVVPVAALRHAPIIPGAAARRRGGEGLRGSIGLPGLIERGRFRLMLIGLGRLGGLLRDAELFW